MDAARLRDAAKIAAVVDARQARKNDLMAALKQDVQQLKEESALNRLPVSYSILYGPAYNNRIQFSYVGSDLKKFVLDNEKDDPLVQGIPKKKNPYRDQKDCDLL